MRTRSQNLEMGPYLNLIMKFHKFARSQLVFRIHVGAVFGKILRHSHGCSGRDERDPIASRSLEVRDEASVWSAMTGSVIAQKAGQIVYVCQIRATIRQTIS